ncbi:MAG: protein disulfide-isomerase [Leptospiraceae bacterium]|nr:MAG: protein disulfide-isomerase [Leptospiraceae bacterium]
MYRKNKIYYLIGLIISFIGIVLSILLVCKHVFPEICSSSLGCTIEGVDGCKELAESDYSKIFGIPIAYLGLIYYIFLALLFGISYFKEQEGNPQINHTRILLLFYATIFGIIFDSILGYINFTKLIVPCLLCVYTYFITLALFVISLVLKNRNKPEENYFTLLQQGLTIFGIAIIIATLILGIYYIKAKSYKTEIVEGELLPPEKVQEYLRDFYALKSVQLSTEGIKTIEGNPEGYIVIHKFADFLCPHCLHTTYILKKALERWPGRIVIYYRQFPLDSTCNPDIKAPPRKPYGDWRCNGSQAAVCAGEYPQFPEFYHELFSLQEQQLPIDLEQLERISNNVGIPWNKLYACMTSPIAQRRINRDVQDAKSIEIDSTPTIVVNNKLVSRGTPDERYFLHLLDALVYEKEGQSAYEEYKQRKK